MVKLSVTSSESTPMTVIPLRAATLTSPSNESSRRASRTGVRLVANSSVMASRSMRLPGANVPVMMRSRSSRAARSRTVREMSNGLDRKIRLEVLIEEVEGLADAEVHRVQPRGRS